MIQYYHVRKNRTPRIDDTFRNQLLELAGGDESLVAPFDNWLFAALPKQPGETIPYVVTGHGEKPILFVPGFTEGVLNKAPLAVDLARRGFQVIVPGQNRNEILRNDKGKKDATLSQAENLIAILHAEDLDTKPGSVDIVAHSFGGLIFESLYKLAQERNLPCFKDAKVVLLDPAGTIHNEWLPRLGVGFAHNMVTETFSPKDFPDSTGIALKAGVGYAFANMARTAREIWEISRRRTDYEKLSRSDIGKLAILSYAESPVFPAKAHQKTMSMIFALEEPTLDIAWMTPVSLEKPDGQSGLRLGKDATHNDDQFNPTRVGGAIAQLL